MVLMLKEKVTISRDDAMSKNYQKEGLENASYKSCKNVKYMDTRSYHWIIKKDLCNNGYPISLINKYCKEQGNSERQHTVTKKPVYIQL